MLILDEPTAALDPEGKQEVFDVLDRIRQTRSMTVIMAEQDTEHIAYWPIRCSSWSTVKWCAMETPAYLPGT